MDELRHLFAVSKHQLIDQIHKNTKFQVYTLYKVDLKLQNNLTGI